MKKRPIIISDLDGTLADVAHRLHYVKPGPCPQCEGAPEGVAKCPKCKGTGQYNPNRWDKFYKACVDDTPLIKTITLVKALQEDINAELWIVSARDALVKPQTIHWLKRFHVLPDMLIMRPTGVSTPDEVLKRSWIEDGTIPKNRVFCVFDDRKKVVDMWRSLGLQTYAVAKGEF